MELSEFQSHSLINIVRNSLELLELPIQQDGLVGNVLQSSMDKKSITDCLFRKCNGVMGVPITFLDKYCPEQFEIVSCHEPAICVDILMQKPNFKSYKSRQIYIDGILCQKTYHRLFVRKK